MSGPKIGVYRVMDLKRYDRAVLASEIFCY